MVGDREARRDRSSIAASCVARAYRRADATRRRANTMIVPQTATKAYDDAVSYVARVDVARMLTLLRRPCRP